MSTVKRASGCLFGLALGDALGSETEFLSVAEIRKRFPPNGPQQPNGSPARVTDDTQMALAVGEALLECGKFDEPAKVEKSLRQAFLKWFMSPDNNRAPGTTCLNACEKLKTMVPWVEATVLNSKGCGANMRVPPVGLITCKSEAQRAAIAQLQAALTHGHATALAASDLTAFATAYLFNGGEPNDMVRVLRDYARSQTNVYHSEWLGDLWQRPGTKSPKQFISRGWKECLIVIDNLEFALERQDLENDPCTITGPGWVAEQAFATGMLCFLLFPDDPPAAIRFAAVSSGDSDSIAALAGAFAGAHCGMTWPADWVKRIEYHDRLSRLAAAWD